MRCLKRNGRGRRKTHRPGKVVAGRKRQHAADHERPCHRKGSFEAGDRRDPAPCQVPPPWTPVHPRRPRWNWCDRKTPAARSADRNDRPGLFSAARQAGLCIAKQNSPLQPPSTAFRPLKGCSTDRSRSLHRHRGSDGRSPITRKEPSHGSHRRIHHQRQHHRRQRSHSNRRNEGPPQSHRARLPRRPGLPRHLWRRRSGSRLELGLGERRALHLPQARRSELQRPDQRRPVAGRKEGDYVLVWSRPNREAA